MNAYGMLETYGLVASIEGADAMVKSSNVSIVGKYNIGSGLVTVIVKGDVGAVNAAVLAGKISAEKIGKVISTHVIPRPSDDIYFILNKKENDEELFKRLSSMKFANLRNMAKDILKGKTAKEAHKKGTKLNSKKGVIEFLMNFKHLL